MSMGRNEIILFGAGDLGLEVLDFLRHSERAATSDGAKAASQVTDIIDERGNVSDDLAAAIGEAVTVHTSFDTIERAGEKQLLICVGDAAARHRILGDWKALEERPTLATVIHPAAVVSDTATVEAGSIIAPFAYVGPGAAIGTNTLVNVHASIGHHVSLGSSCVVSPQVAINGRASLGDAVFLGAGVIIAPRQAIGQFSKVANGAIVSKSCGEGFLLAGNPAKGRQMFKIPEIRVDQK